MIQHQIRKNPTANFASHFEQSPEYQRPPMPYQNPNHQNQLTDYDRDHFDDLLERVLNAQPQHIHDLLQEVPLIVEDRPSKRLVNDFCRKNPGLNRRHLPFQLCGLYTGFPITIRSVHQDSRLPDRIQLFRIGITLAARRHHQNQTAQANTPDLSTQDAALHEQIRITLLHEIGHHFGLNEQDLTNLGYG